jgi:hypothetical protein
MVEKYGFLKFVAPAAKPLALCGRCGTAEAVP